MQHDLRYLETPRTYKRESRSSASSRHDDSEHASVECFRNLGNANQSTECRLLAENAGRWMREDLSNLRDNLGVLCQLGITRGSLPCFFVSHCNLFRINRRVLFKFARGTDSIGVLLRSSPKFVTLRITLPTVLERIADVITPFRQRRGNHNMTPRR